MIDLSGADPGGPFEPGARQITGTAVIDLLNETVDLTAAAHLSASRLDTAGQYAAVRARIQELTGRLAVLLPELPAGTGAVEGGALRIADLARAGIPQTDIGEQRRYGAVFRALDDAGKLLKELAAPGLETVARAREGFISGTLRP